MKQRDVVLHHGVRFIRYPDSDNLSDSRYYKAWYVLEGNRRKHYLHRVLWTEAKGAIPDGHHIHHLDGNTLNNSLDNLACLPSEEHLTGHWLESSEDSKARKKQVLLTKAQEAAKEWHGSAEGRAWHGKNAKAYWAKRQPTIQQCSICGKDYQTKDLRFGHLKFCSKVCQAKERRESGVDNVERTCPICDAVFIANKYAKAQTCGRACGSILKRQNRLSKA